MPGRPEDHFDQHRCEVHSGFGQAVNVAACIRRIPLFGNDAQVFQPLQPIREYVAGDAFFGFQKFLVGFPTLEHQVADDEQRPAVLDEAARETGAHYELRTVCSGDAFLTTDEKFLTLISDAISDKTGLMPEHSTTGGTSDARFIKDVAPVCEFGLVGKTIHQIDEQASVADILALADIYEAILDRYFAAYGGRA